MSNAPAFPFVDPVAHGIPQHLVHGIENYVVHHLLTGGFLRACFSNDLIGAVSRADFEALKALPSIVNYIHYFTPSECHGSPEKVTKWTTSPAGA